MDHRLNAVWARFLWTFRLRVGGTDYDELRIAGGAADLPQLMKHLKLAFVKHGVRKVILTVHEDCAAGAVEADLLRAMKEIKEANYIGLEVRAYYFYRSGKTWAWRNVTH